ncbi:MAG: response regulator, partial [bacterium]
MMEAPAPSGEKTAPGNIFVVDDDPETVAFIRAVLSEGGHRVETATDPRVFLNKEVPFVPDVILLDVMMPEMSGIEVMEKIKKACTERGIRLVTVSALSGEADIENAYRAGADDYIVKPFETGELLLRVERQLRIRER